MVFGFSWGEVALILAASAALFGPKDIVVIGRAAGRLTGKAVGYIQSARGQLDPILQRSEINVVHKELRDTMAQLEAIRHEMRTGISLMNPGPMTRQVMETAVESHATGTDVGSDLEKTPPVADHLNSGLSGPLSPTQMVMQMQELRIASKKDEPAVPLNASTPSPHVAVTRVGLATVLHPSQVPEHSDCTIGGSPAQKVLVLPISAVEAGLLPSNQGSLLCNEPLSGGADIVFASIMERKVAFQSQKFFEEGES